MILTQEQMIFTGYGAGLSLVAQLIIQLMIAWLKARNEKKLYKVEKFEALGKKQSKG
jgi:hypothetical protein